MKFNFCFFDINVEVIFGYFQRRPEKNQSRETMSRRASLIYGASNEVLNLISPRLIVNNTIKMSHIFIYATSSLYGTNLRAFSLYLFRLSPWDRMLSF